MEYASATSKSAAVARMYLLAGIPAEPLGPGSKEKRSALEALGSAVGLDLRETRTKHRCAEEIAHAVDVAWDDRCRSTGDTITLEGMNRLVDAVALARLRAVSADESASLVERLLASRTPDPYQGSQPHDKEPFMPQDATELEQNIADYLARLSEPGPVPEDFDEPHERFAAEDVRFDDGSWRQRLADVQAWLHLPSPLDETSPAAFDASLSGALGLEVSAMPEDLLDSLAQRLDRALALREEFAAAMERTVEGTETLTSASLKWSDAWEDAAEDDGVEQSGQIDATAETWPIQDFVQRARYGQLNLSPSYQRADVWPTGDSQRLIESILRGIPLPSVIILEKVVDRRTEYEVVDGKQRLTSVLRFIGAHPHAVEVVKQKSDEWSEPGALELFRRNYPEFKALWAKHEKQRLTAQVERQNHFPFPLRATDTADSRNPLTGDREKLRGKYYCEIREEIIEIQGQPLPVNDIFEMASTYKVPVIKYKKVTTAQVHEVFSLYNKQGKHLNAEEIRNALYHELHLMRALLVTAGDSKDVKVVADFLVDDWDDLRSTGEILTQYAFGDVGYKRTKILSWVAAALLLEEPGVTAITRSTAGQINALLHRVSENKRDHLRNPEIVRQLMLLIDHGLDAHAAPAEVWSKSFRSGSERGSGKWQELRLVASLIGLTAAAAVLGDDLTDAFESVAPDVLEASAAWGKPARNQSKQQWDWIGFVVGQLLELVGVDADKADRALRERFGSSGLKTLVGLPEAAQQS
ncbi:DUF262 domain-containing protein [Puerhibacterium sp. TATVAM-FAB25]|uniref:DUF262 domain-containing protein n=1 Tax=Puerhibacterium sp. TATVAM-FAB25 TaxID=3093699 RepID=UPI003979A389